MEDTCLFCGTPVVERRMICHSCEEEYSHTRKNNDCLNYSELLLSRAIIPTSDYRVGDVCIYSFNNENKSCSIVQIVKILDDERGIAKVKFLNVIKDDSGNGLFKFLLKCGKTMNASFEYLTNITPRVDD